MENRDALNLTAVFLCGLVSGGIYFLFMWRSIKKYNKNGGVSFFILKTVFRLFLLVSFLFFVAKNDFIKYLIFMFAFVLSKIISLRISRRAEEA